MLGGRPDKSSARLLTLLPWVPTTPRCRQMFSAPSWMGPLPASWRWVLPHTLLPSRPELLKAVRLPHLDSPGKDERREGYSNASAQRSQCSVFVVQPSWLALVWSWLLSKHVKGPWCELDGTQTHCKLLEDVGLTGHTSTPASEPVLPECLKVWLFLLSFFLNIYIYIYIYFFFFFGHTR